MTTESEDDYTKGECTNCQGSISFPTYAIGMTHECPHCSQETVLTPAATPPPAPEPAAAASPPAPPPPPPPPPSPPPAQRPPTPAPTSSRPPDSGGPHKPFGGIKSKHRYSAQGMAKPINFFYSSPEAKAVSVVGDFNKWNPTVHPMQKQADGNWFVTIELNHGHHAYMLQVDDRIILDPRATGITRNEKGERVSLLAVS